MVTLAHYGQSPPGWSLPKQLSPPGPPQACGSTGMQPGHQQSQPQHQHSSQQQTPPRKRTKQAVCQEFIQNLRARQGFELDTPGVVEGIQTHFQLLPSRYALDVNIDSLDVLNHKRLLDSARSDPSAVSFQVRRVEVPNSSNGRQHRHSDQRAAFNSMDSHIVEAAQSVSQYGANAARPLARPAFGSSPSLLSLDLEDSAAESASDYSGVGDAHFYEVTIGSVDQPKLLSRLTDALGDLDLNICEAHAFTTTDKFSLDVFVVNGWQGEGGGELESVLSERLRQLPAPSAPHVEHSHEDAAELGISQTLEPEVPEIDRPSVDGHGDDWELDPSEVLFQDRIASGAFGDLFRGNYCGQDVAIKVLKNVQDDSQQYREFLQEVAIMRKVRHRNVVQFIGACTKKPNLCIVFEFMAGGSIYDHLHKGGRLSIPQALKIGVEVARGMDYLHKRRIIHRDLKAANLLMDEMGTVKIGDFGVARVLDSAGVMTAETGTYRWMAPEVIEHSPYNHQADIFSFAIVLWELLTGRVPYADMTPLQAAVGVVQKGLRPPIPANCPPALATLMQDCWVRNPKDRPSFETLKHRMVDITTSWHEEDAKAKQSAPTGIFSKLRKNIKGSDRP